MACSGCNGNKKTIRRGTPVKTLTKQGQIITTSDNKKFKIVKR